jgi:hypothetical protein
MKDGEKVVISFAVSAPTDVEVAILDRSGEVVRHLAAGVLGGEKPPPVPLRTGLKQRLVWDGKDDFRQPAEGGPFRVRARATCPSPSSRTAAQRPMRPPACSHRHLRIGTKHSYASLMSCPSRRLCWQPRRSRHGGPGRRVGASMAHLLWAVARGHSRHAGRSVDPLPVTLRPLREMTRSNIGSWAGLLEACHRCPILCGGKPIVALLPLAVKR